MLGVAACAVVVWMDKVADKHDKRRVEVEVEEKFEFSDIKRLGKPIWLVGLVAFCQEVVMYPYISIISPEMLQIKYGYSEEQAARIVFLPFVISPFICVPLGYVIDITGRRVLYCKSLVSLILQ